MEQKKELKILLLIVGVFLGFYFLPIDSGVFRNAIFEALYLAKWYAREHVVLCLIPAFFIAGAISVFVSREAVMKYLGAKANKALAYGVASVSGGILAVCSCTVLPLFAGIKRMGAGIGPATTFLYSGPAINIMAIVLTASVLGVEMGIARAVGAVIFSIIIGLLMELFFPENREDIIDMPSGDDSSGRGLLREGLYFGLMVAILVIANWSSTSETGTLYAFMSNNKWIIAGVLSAVFALVLYLWYGIKWYKLVLAAGVTIISAMIWNDYPILIFSIGISGLIVILATNPGEGKQWLESTWDLTKQIAPLLFYGVLIAGFLLGSPEGNGVIPNQWINSAVGGNSLASTAFASIAGAMMYFATLTEIPILQGLIAGGMGKGPALALLLAGPALSLPNMLVIKSVIGWRKTLGYISLVIIMSTLAGFTYGMLF